MGVQLQHGHSHASAIGHAPGQTTSTKQANTKAKKQKTKDKQTISKHPKVLQSLSNDNNKSNNKNNMEVGKESTQQQRSLRQPLTTNSHIEHPNTNENTCYRLTQDNEDASYRNATNANNIDHRIAHPHKDVHINLNVRAAFIHVLGDMVQSIGVFIAALVIYFKPDWAIADPICTFIFSVIVLITTFSIIKDAVLVLMEGTPSFLHYAEVLNIFKEIEGVQRVHNLRIWALSISKVALAVHLAIAENANPKKILQEATTAVHMRYNFFETTIQIEDFTADMENCKQCTLPDI